MSVGTLHANIILNEPGRIHCGSHDPVQGHVSIRYTPGPRNVNAELFGPLNISVNLHGRVKSKIWKSNGQSTSIYRGRAQLFLEDVGMNNLSFRAKPGETQLFPFSISFPENAHPLRDKHGKFLNQDTFDEDPRFNISPYQPLPPSFQNSYHGFAHRYESFVEYRLGVEIGMPQLQVDVIKPIEDQEPIIHYERPRVTPSTEGDQPTEWRGYISVRNELLLPEADRPSGFRQKTKALFGAGHFPTYSFDWICSAPKHIHLGQPVCFEVKIMPREHECTATLVPDVRLKYFRMELTAYTQVRSKRVLLRCQGSEGKYTVCEMVGFIDSRDPFSKANDNTKLINTDAIGSGRIGSFVASFTTFNISQTYILKIGFAFEVAGQVKHIDREYAIMVYPPLEMPIHSPATTAGPSSQPIGGENNGPDLPPYETAPSYKQ
ncbi:hypothetical protein NPX13_g1976 [Xylaria arbuscula]|uniref:Arrestin-like N-terminal domain-containing protein n=1 Tax=Xylaria arbuscula TaxID=114810 RepID=A0A9W8NLB3_9PEZI|nr:hypothetical protein NPX13_g1976 [Xylaria arbuscula]